MNKTLYVKDADAEMWAEAEKLVPGGISPLVTSLLADWVKRNRPPNGHGFERLEVELYDSEEEPRIRKSFLGRWLIAPEEEFEAHFSEEEQAERCFSVCAGTTHFYAVAQTKKGNLAVYRRCEQRSTHAEKSAELEVFDSFDELKDASDDGGRTPLYPRKLLSAVAELLNQPYSIELDI